MNLDGSLPERLFTAAAPLISAGAFLVSDLIREPSLDGPGWDSVAGTGLRQSTPESDFETRMGLALRPTPAHHPPMNKPAATPTLLSLLPASLALAACGATAPVAKPSSSAGPCV